MLYSDRSTVSAWLEPSTGGRRQSVGPRSAGFVFVPNARLGFSRESRLAGPIHPAAIYLAQGFKESFHILYEVQELRSINGMEDIVRNKIRKELEGSHLSGPHSSLPLPNLHISLLVVVPQKAPG